MKENSIELQLEIEKNESSQKTAEINISLPKNIYRLKMVELERDKIAIKQVQIWSRVGDEYKYVKAIHLRDAIDMLEGGVIRAEDKLLCQTKEDKKKAKNPPSLFGTV